MAFPDWTTITNYNQSLYKTKANENFEFIISSSFKNPVFMVFWNGIKYNGTITGLSPIVSKVAGTRYKGNSLCKNTIAISFNSNNRYCFRR